MKQYIYKPSAAGLREWPSGELRLQDIEITENPDEADVFTVPGALTQLFPSRESLYRLPYFKGREANHAIFDCSDNDQVYDLPCIFIRCNTRPWYLEHDPSTISWPWPVEEYAECIPVPDGQFRFDVSFQGWLSSEVRKQSAESCRNNRLLKTDIATYGDFCGYLHDRTTGEWTAEGLRRRKEFRRSMKESRIALCPESIPGVFPYRFFEAMSAGRVPLLVGSDFVWPWNKDIPYESFSIVCPRDLADHADQIALTFLRSHSDEEIVSMGKQARTYWETYLDSRSWSQLHAIAVTRKLEELKSKCA